MSGSGVIWAICKSALRSRQITTPAPHHSFLQAGSPSCRPTNSVKALKAVTYGIKLKISTASSLSMSKYSRPKMPLTNGRSWLPRNTWFIGPQPNRHLNRFSRFCTAHGQTDRPRYNGNNRPHLMLCIAMRSGNNMQLMNL